MTNSGPITIAIAQNRFSTSWQNETMSWDDFCDRLKTPVTGVETLPEYRKLSAKRQDDLKDVGGYTGELSGSRRTAQAIVGRDLVTLDLDNIPEGGTDETLELIDSLNFKYCVYSTRKHCFEKPRLRLVVPLDRTATPDEYEPLARKLAEFIGIEKCDPSTFQASRLMYFPSICRGAVYVYKRSSEGRGRISVDGFLALYPDWHDATQWPIVPGIEKRIESEKRLAGDPLEKEGLVGIFCRTYDIHRAIAEFLQGVYIPCGENRYTYAAGSTSGGAVVYDDKFLYSNHATDPASCQLCNAFDLVRIHVFGHLDAEVKEGVKPSDRPSMAAMSKFASSCREVFEKLLEDRQKGLAQDFSTPVEPEPVQEDSEEKDTVNVTDLTWQDKLERNRTGGIAKTRNNILNILINDPALSGRIGYNEFTDRMTVFGGLPWAEQGDNETRLWTDADDSGLRWYIEGMYKVSSTEAVADALALVARRNRRDSLKEYLNSLKWDGVERLDRMFIDYLGAPDTAYVREVTRKQMCAAAARGLRPGVKHDVMLVLTGPQGIGKSTMMSILGGDWFTDSISDFGGRDAYEGLIGRWIIEVPELASMNRAEVNTVKTFLSKTEDVFRAAYGHRSEAHPRRCVFFGTTNDHEYLRDVTGSRRFWPLEVGVSAAVKDVFTDLRGERDQLWAEAAAKYRAGESLMLSEEVGDAVQAAQETHREHSVKEGIVAEFLQKPIPVDWNDWPTERRRLWWSDAITERDAVETTERTSVCAIEVWAELFGGDVKFMRRADTLEINNVITAIGGWSRAASPIRCGPYGVQRGFKKG